MALSLSAHRRGGVPFTWAPVALVLLALSDAARAAPAQPTPLPPVVAKPRDVDYPGMLRLSVDATDVTHGIFRIRETIPVQGGRQVTLLYPQWIPGDHAPTGRLPDLAGLIISAGGQRLEWRRDVVDVNAFHVRPPPGAKTIDLEFQFVSPTDEAQGRIVMTAEMLNLQWHSVSLYPAGFFTRRIPIEARLTLPEGWTLASALPVASKSGAETHFSPVPYETLVDSPVFAGRYAKAIDLDPGAPVRVTLNLFADRPGLLDAKPDQITAHRALVQQAYRLFGARHFDHYDFLLALTDRLGAIGLEHHRSSENSLEPEAFTDWDKQASDRDLLPHEFTHSWNGKYRRPADLWTADFNTPMRNSLLWVYEGQTQYWGFVLAARSGLITPAQALDAIAMTAAAYDHTPGRAWKALQDTTNDPIVSNRAPQPWRSWQREEDYYSEGQLVWLDADTLIRQRSGGKRSLDDVAKAFFGVNDGSFSPLTYTFEDVVKALNGVEPYDWAGFLRARLDGHGPDAPLDGIARGGYRLVYTDTPSAYEKDALALAKREDFTYSLGFSVGKEDVLTSVLWDGQAFKAGLTVGAKLIAVNGEAYDANRLKEAVTAAKGSGPALDLLIKTQDHYRTVRIDYHDGLRYPHLDKTPDAPALLDAILAPRPGP